MARKTSKFMVGLFVIAGSLITAVAIIWIGATQYFQVGQLYVTYFDESVAGLQRDSEVKYRGVTVGRVDDIRIAPDNRLIAIVMSINLRGEPSKNLVAQLQLTGITGLMFINLDIREPGDLEFAPKFDFASEYPVIPSKPSDIKRLLGSAEAIVSKIKEIDFQAISAQVKATVGAIEKFVESKELKGTMANVEVATANLKNLSGQIDKLVAEGQVQKAVADARESLVGAKELFAQLKADLEAVKLPQIGSKTRSLLGEMEATTEKLKTTSETLGQLAERLEYRPSDLIFGDPPKPRWNEK